MKTANYWKLTVIVTVSTFKDLDPRTGKMKEVVTARLTRSTGLSQLPVNCKLGALPVTSHSKGWGVLPLWRIIWEGLTFTAVD